MSSHKQNFSALEQRLRTERPTFTAPEGFTERVMERLERPHSAPTATRRIPVFRLFLSFAGAVALTLVAVKVFDRRQPQADAEQLAQAISRIKLPDISAERVEALTAKLDEPLEMELKNVISDTRQAIQFVASNFLPETN